MQQFPKDDGRQSRPAPNPTPGENLLVLTDIVKQFMGVHALSGVDLTIRAGEVHALVGENGAGKSTLIKVATGVYQPDGGTIRFLGEDRHFPTPLDAQRAGISTIYQEVNLVPLMSVARNFFLGREPRKRGSLDMRRMNREAAESLAKYGIHVDPTRALNTLGLGTQQMVAIARAVDIDARVVIMDEPTSSLEQRESETLFRVIKQLQGQGLGILYVSHRLDELYRICDRVTVMRDGKVVHNGDLAEVPRLKLISLMLGRDMAAVSKEGTTAFTENHDVADKAVLEAKDLHARHTLHGVSLKVRPGEVVGLGGLLGAGRSETAKAVFGALHTEDGHTSIEGKPLRRNSIPAAVKAGAAMLPEDRKLEGIIPNLSVRENIVLAALPRISKAGLISRSKQDEIVEYFIKRLNIKCSGPDQPVVELSGGNQQKVLLARLMCLDPKVLLLDEPTRGIDVGAKAEVQGVIDELASKGLGVVLISSELEELLEGSRRIVVLKDGSIVGELKGNQVNEKSLMNALASGSDDSGADDETPTASGSTAADKVKGQ